MFAIVILHSQELIKAGFEFVYKLSHSNYLYNVVITLGHGRCREKHHGVQVFVLIITVLSKVPKT